MRALLGRLHGGANHRLDVREGSLESGTGGDHGGISARLRSSLCPSLCPSVRPELRPCETAGLRSGDTTGCTSCGAEALGGR